MKLYIVMYYDYDWSYNHGVFSTHEGAVVAMYKARVKNKEIDPSAFRIVEFILDRYVEP
jgi:hypothetical protein